MCHHWEPLARSAPLQTRVWSAVEMGVDSSITSRRGYANDRIFDNNLIPLQISILHLCLYCPFQLLPSFAPGVTDSDPSDFQGSFFCCA